MQAWLLFRSVTQGDVSGDGHHRDASLRECRLHCNLQDARHLFWLRNQFAVVAALREEMFWFSLLKISAPDFIAWNLRRDRQDRNAASVAVVQSVD
jgi:hypothetical protein